MRWYQVVLLLLSLWLLARAAFAFLRSHWLNSFAASPDIASVRIGNGKTTDYRARQVAALYVPYAILATRAYEPLDSDGEIPPLLVNHRKLPQKALDLLKDDWECIYAHSGSWPRPPGPPWQRYRPVIDGLGVQIWQSKPKDGACREFVIAFRGSESQVGDWLANFRWLTRFFLLFDHYRQVRAHIDERIAWIKAQESYRPTSKIIAVGHSLGGGLAQQAAYANSDIRFVCAFDSTPVTGYYDVARALRLRNEKGLRIDRVYESGEILSHLRAFMSRLYKVTGIDPEIREVRFSYGKGSSIDQHSMVTLTTSLMQEAPGEDASPRSPQFELPGAPAG